MMLLRCSSQERLCVKITPRCLWLVTLSTGVLLNVSGCGFSAAFFVNMRSLVFPVLKVTFHLVAQEDTFFRSLLSRLDVSSALSPVAMSVVSSAKMCGVDSRSLIMSFMNRIKSNGPSLEPCGTPASTGCSEDSAPSTTVLAFLLLRYDFSRSSGLPLMFI